MKKTKLVLIISIICLITSCNTKQKLNSQDYIIIYDNLEQCDIITLDGEKILRSIVDMPASLIFKTSWNKDPEFNSYEYHSLGDYCYVGKWTLEGDTITLYPLYEFRYGDEPDMIKFDADSPYYRMKRDIYHQWVIKGDRIYEKENYVLHDEYDEDGNFVKTTLMPSSNPNNNFVRRSKTKLK